ncbi:MAG: CCA tRNA nucleotidyltransferase [Nanoarchaeota archaeon]|nr:CCA tRNA nucleotidyltransferase [Nanoarchaeota archaeon]|tara:strand:- start:181 stop:1389 length:1209 start_codon:yes stop_codon:yes gene_type:complete
MLKVLNEIKPSVAEKKAILSTAKHFVSKINSRLTEGKAVLGGSVAKGTWLKGDYDIDIFVLFNKEYKNEDISKILETKLEKLKPNKISGIRKVHGSRDYFQINQDPYNFEIVPILKISKANKAENITDVSPLHTKWVKKKAKKKLLDEIRLSKVFAKANKLYGAESYIKGLSGYTLEVLTIHYGSFSRLMENVAKWKKGVKIDVEKHNDGLNRSKKGPLIVIDPVQHDRNTAAALSDKKFDKFIGLAKKFNRNPSLEFFKRENVSLESLKGAVIVKAKALKGKEDIVGNKLLKAFEFIGKRLKEEGYEITKYDWEWDKEALFWYRVKVKTLPKSYMHFGPPVKEEKHVEKFREKYKGKKLQKKDGKIYVNLERENPNVVDYLRELLKNNYIKEKVKEINVLE